eukprot:TRINITY_DN1643_c1_g1_i1.p1 TRINITY_DN1643_c1_g1~~TRINITY_DN1643_c1_g1_i1.p1  ORF type:complete len:259 (-),score=29.62 TRINITY_DN1643_c1_g1_i1:411-1187(-)
MFAASIALLLFIVTTSHAVNKNCTSESACTCQLKSAGLLNLAGSGGITDYVEVTEGDYTYRYYPCGMRVDWGGVCVVSNSPAVCQLGPENEYYILGTARSYEIIRAVAKGDTTYFDFLFKDGTSDFIYGKRSAAVRVSCERTKLGELEFISEAPTIKYNLNFKTDKACFSPATDPLRNVIFIALMVLVTVAVVAYFGVGVGIMAVKGERRWGLIPNLQFWKAAPFLFLDGFLFTFSCFPGVRKYFRGSSKQQYDDLSS